MSLSDNQNSTSTKTLDEKFAKPNGNRNYAIFVFTAIIIILALAWAALWYFDFRYEQYTDDAYANGNMMTINSAISGSVIAFYADNTDLVKEGQKILSLDSTEYEITYRKAIARLAETVLEVQQIYDKVDVSRALVENNRIQYKKALYDFQNRSMLVESKAISNEDFIHARDSFLMSEFTLKQSEAELKVAIDAAGNTKLEIHPKILEQSAALKSAYYNLKHCTIYAPSTGYVAQRSAQVGQWVNPNTPLMAIIPTDYVWVDANFKETQLNDMRVGQEAEVSFDMYGRDVVYKGKVIGIGMGSGSVFSIIPPQNATGNWIKIVQRLPVRISLDPETVKKYPVRLGISAEVYVDISNTNLPRLSQNIKEGAIATTDVFTIDMSQVDVLIEKTISDNLIKKK